MQDSSNGAQRPRAPASSVRDPAEDVDRTVPLRRLLKQSRPALRLVWRASPSETLRVAALQILTGLTLPLQLVVGKQAVEALIDAGEDGSGVKLLPVTLLLVATLSASRLVAVAARQRQRLLPELVGQTAQYMLAEKAASLDLATLETPTFSDRLARAQREAVFRPVNMVSDLTRVVSSGVSIVGLLVLLFAAHPLLVIVVLLSVAPLWSASIASGRAYYSFMTRNTQLHRLIHYVLGILTQPHSAKETRAFGLGPYLLRKQRELFDKRLEQLQEASRRIMRRDLLASFASSALTAAGLLLVLWLHLSDRLSLGEAAAAAGSLLFIAQRLNELTSALGFFHENVLFIEDFWSFLELAPARVATHSGEPPPEGLEKLSVQDVSFTYPESPTPALQNVSVEIRRGETVALVGENGAGKTTLAKLLCRLYEPDAGTIRWNDRDVLTCDPGALRKRIAVIFQDFARYMLSARENIGLGCVDAIDDLSRITRAARFAGADEFLSALPAGYETMLGRMFDEGQEMSIGQWQRIALARAFLRDACLVVMDEPTASLDARAEYELFETMRTLFEDRAVLLISHRFSSVRMADRIYVFKKGQVVEQGSHEELMVKGGLYAELFDLQAAAYLPEKTS